MSKKIELAHGEGGEHTSKLIKELFVKYFNHAEYTKYDAATLLMPSKKICMTTDSFVVKPLIFKGGSIGKMAVAGTVNDLVVSGAKPLFMTVNFIIEEGLSFSVLESIVSDIAQECEKAGIQIVGGDTKVVEEGKGDGIFITTTGIGEKVDTRSPMIGEAIKDGDKIIVTGDVGRHGATILLEREDFPIESDIESDCASLHDLLLPLLQKFSTIKLMRDATRGGLATTLIEWTEDFQALIELEESDVPVSDTVKGYCKILGYDPLFLANEGTAMILVGKEEADAVLQELKKHSLGKKAAVIGSVYKQDEKGLYVITEIGTRRKLHKMKNVQLPRIC